MLILTKPATQSRLDSAIVEVVGLNIMGPVYIPGSWDAYSTKQYAEIKLKQLLAMYHHPEAGVYFFANGKQVHFTLSGVLIHPPETTIPP